MLWRDWCERRWRSSGRSPAARQDRRRARSANRHRKCARCRSRPRPRARLWELAEETGRRDRSSAASAAGSHRGRAGADQAADKAQGRFVQCVPDGPWREMDSNNRFLLGRRSRELALLRIRASAISRLLAMAALRAAVERVGIHRRPSPIHKGSPRDVLR
jgi:hypothetical protein